MDALDCSQYPKLGLGTTENNIVQKYTTDDPLEQNALAEIMEIPNGALAVAGDLGTRSVWYKIRFKSG